MENTNEIQEVLPAIASESNSISNLGQNIDALIEMYENQDIDADELEYFISILTGE